MAPGYVFQVSLRFTIQNQIRISQRVIVDEIIQLRPLRHGHVQCILFLLEQFLISPNERTEDYNRRIIDTFVNRIDITDTEMLIYFNLSEASASAKTKKFPVEQLFDWESSGPPDTFSLEQFFPLRHPQFFLYASFKPYFFSYIVSAALYSISKNCPAVGR